MLTRLQHTEYVMISNHRGQRHDATAQRLAQQVDISRDVLMLQGECAAGSPQPRLDLVGNEQHPMLASQLPRPGHIACWRDAYARLALDRLQQECDNIISERLPERFKITRDRLPERFKITVRDRHETWSVRSVVIMRERIVGETDDRCRPAVEVASRNDSQ